MENVSGKRPFVQRDIHDSVEKEDLFDRPQEEEGSPTKLPSWKESFSNLLKSVKDLFARPFSRRSTSDIEETEDDTVTYGDPPSSSKTSIFDGFKRAFNSLIDFCSSIIVRIKGTYKKGSLEHNLVQEWDRCYKTFKSTNTQAQLDRVKSMNERHHQPDAEIVRNLMEDIHTFIHETEKEEMRYGSKTIIGPCRDLVFNTMLCVPKKILNRITNIPASIRKDGGNEEVHVGKGLIIQASIMVDLLKYIKETKATGDESKLNDAVDTLAIMMAAFMVSNPEVSSDTEKRVVTTKLPELIRKNKIVLAFSEGMMQHRNHVVNEMTGFVDVLKRKMGIEVPVSSEVMDELRKKHNVPSDCSEDQVAMVFVLDLLSKTGILSYDGCNKGGYDIAGLQNLFQVLKSTTVDLSSLNNTLNKRGFQSNFVSET